MKYSEFLKKKEFNNDLLGFKPLWIPEFLFPFQQELTSWAIRKGRAALFEDCGLGKTPQQLVWAQNVIKKTNKKVLIVTPLAVSYQTIKEAEKFGIQAKRSSDGKSYKNISVTNYERLSKFNSKDFVGIVCDESSILKGFDGKTRKLITKFVKDIKYHLLCTATPAPNDFMELGTSAEALGMMTLNQMLAMFFTHKGTTTSQWLLKGHANKRRFWQWMSTWARAIRKPSDLGFDDDGFILPKLSFNNYTVEAKEQEGYLFPPPALTLNEQRAAKRNTLQDRCEKTADIVNKKKSSWVSWCHLNDEGDLLEHLIEDSVQVSGKDKDDMKEGKLVDFANGNIRILITKPRIGGFGMNWQHCSNITYFPSHSYEQFYQCIRRCWRFGQKHKVTCSIVSGEQESIILENMLRKEKQANEMYDGIIKHMTEFQTKKKIIDKHKEKIRIPKWL